MSAAESILATLRRNRAGEAVGVASLCTAHPLVLRIALRRAAAAGGTVLIEATCNQVNQHGGYTGMTPADFRDRQWALADSVGLPRAQLLLGGDHLGPNPWRARPAAEAMQQAKALVAAFAAAGYRKLHLDASMSCADDPLALPPEIIADRAAEFCAVAEQEAARAGLPPPFYVVGTEVPTPGGATAGMDHLAVTPASDVAATLALHRDAFARHGQLAALERVAAVVVQPGVEFGQDEIHDFAPEAARDLAAALAGSAVVFEAHSTDYQRANALRALVQQHFAILKVGPELTFALREAILALDVIAAELHPGRGQAVRAALEAAMHNDPRWWHGYMPEHDRAGRLFGLSDRVRYYWPVPDVEAAVAALWRDLKAIPPSLASQYLPVQAAAWRDGALALTPDAVTAHRVGLVLERYAAAISAR